MRNRIKFCSSLLLLWLPLLSGCTGKVAVDLPPAAALSSCSHETNPVNMVPRRLSPPADGWDYRIRKVRVVGPPQQKLQPVITAASFRTALTQAVRMSGLSTTSDSSGLPQYILLAQFISQQRKGTFTSSRVKLVVYYSLIPQNGPAKVMRNQTITAVDELHDWRRKPCSRLRAVQAQLVRKSIQRLFHGILQEQS